MEAVFMIIATLLIIALVTGFFYGTWKLWSAYDNWAGHYKTGYNAIFYRQGKIPNKLTGEYYKKEENK
jgi:hypothetical protein